MQLLSFMPSKVSPQADLANNPILISEASHFKLSATNSGSSKILFFLAPSDLAEDLTECRHIRRGRPDENCKHSLNVRCINRVAQPGAAVDVTA
ncbi:hypothetical protein TNIN_297961 [Trichonephila inaurata madagascariensis]|uniref:Uncharacterized protein n=1 Tax=Trichonephila inaurata madagascariensis TaxID=2747483 RepID=A0A8X7BZK0_9ARAC|nr:hypothetical protein TNIN_297961 [Trichonephila inaurata madagascariensis]